MSPLQSGSSCCEVEGFVSARRFVQQFALVA